MKKSSTKKPSRLKRKVICRYIVSLTETYRVEVEATSRADAAAKVTGFGGAEPVFRKETVRLARRGEHGSENT